MARSRQAVENQEELPLIKHQPNPYRVFTLQSLDLINGYVAALAPFFTVITPFEAYPKWYPHAYNIGLAAALPSCIAKNALDISAERGNVTAKLAQKPVNRIINATNVANFSLTATIALVVMIYATIHFHHDKDKKVGLGDLAYGLGLVLPTSLLGVAYAVLEWTKQKWEHAPSRTAQAIRASHHAVHSFYNASNLNSLFALGLAPFGISETGNVNPYGRLSIFLTALGLGIACVIISNQKPQTASSIERIINTSCAIAYLGQVFSRDSRELLGEGFTTTFILTFSALALASCTAAYIQAFAINPRPARSAFVQNNLFTPSAETSTSYQSIELGIAP